MNHLVIRNCNATIINSFIRRKQSCEYESSKIVIAGKCKPNSAVVVISMKDGVLFILMPSVV